MLGLKLAQPTRPDTNEGRPLLVINADTAARREIPADRSKERLTDYAMLKSTLRADILDWNDIKQSRLARLLSRVTGKGVTLAALAFARRRRYGVFYCDSENNGLVLALLFKLSATRKPLLMIGHWIVPPKKALLIKFLRLHTHISTIFLHSSAQYERAIAKLGIPAHRLKLLPYQVDTEFWRTEHATVAPAERPYICTAGLEFRDYPTLVEAVRDLPMDLKIGAASNWSKRKDSSLNLDLPPNVSVSSYNYTELRDLYAGCAFVVVPLYEAEAFQAGITLILEAMAMGKAVIVSRTSGQGDTIVDRRKTIRTASGQTQSTTGKFTELFRTQDLVELDGATGFYVTPGNPSELRRAINYLLQHPEVARELGRRSRETVASLMSVELFCERIKQAVLEHYEPAQPIDLPLAAYQPQSEVSMWN